MPAVVKVKKTSAYTLKSASQQFRITGDNLVLSLSRRSAVSGGGPLGVCIMIAPGVSKVAVDMSDVSVAIPMLTVVSEGSGESRPKLILTLKSGYPQARMRVKGCNTTLVGLSSGGEVGSYGGSLEVRGARGGLVYAVTRGGGVLLVESVVSGLNVAGGPARLSQRSEASWVCADRVEVEESSVGFVNAGELVVGHGSRIDAGFTGLRIAGVRPPDDNLVVCGRPVSIRETSEEGKSEARLILDRDVDLLGVLGSDGVIRELLSQETPLNSARVRLAVGAIQDGKVRYE